MGCIDETKATNVSIDEDEVDLSNISVEKLLDYTKKHDLNNK